jgi:hypothetical protein
MAYPFDLIAVNETLYKAKQLSEHTSASLPAIFLSIMSKLYFFTWKKENNDEQRFNFQTYSFQELKYINKFTLHQPHGAIFLRVKMKTFLHASEQNMKRLSSKHIEKISDGDMSKYVLQLVQ